jgi:tRNA threonylcarbamoyladenosine biosynthesis protein TsaB
MYLCIDTISSAAGITLVGSKFATFLPLDPMNSSAGIIPTIDQALKKGKAELADIEGIYVIKGPGSFTGLRVGLSVANQFAHQLKIPITGLRTDEWWQYRANQSEVTYLQSMNREEVFVSKNGETSIKPLKNVAPCVWFGQLTAEHRAQLSKDFKEIKKIDSVEGTWQKVVKELADSHAERITYDLIEPFYGKEPSITKSKKTIFL